jgi:hypothetical protein
MKMRMCLAGGVVVALCATVQAQFYTGFEAPPFSGSAAGVVATGQQGWYQPVVGGRDSNIYTYAGNALGLVQNPVGGDQFLGGTSGGGVLAARAQVNFDFGAST